MIGYFTNEPPRGKTNNLHMRQTKTQISFAVTAKLIITFVFATRIVLFLFYLNPKFQASSSFLCLYRSVCVGPVRKPHCWFSHGAAQITYANGITKFPNLGLVRTVKILCDVTVVCVNDSLHRVCFPTVISQYKTAL